MKPLHVTVTRGRENVGLALDPEGDRLRVRVADLDVYLRLDPEGFDADGERHPSLLVRIEGRR